MELDGRPWRTLPAGALAAAGVTVGVEIDRERARTIRAELRGADAIGKAVTALRARDHSRASLAARLAERGVAPAHRERALAALERAGLVDDARVAAGRARVLAERGSGDAMIREDLVRRGIPAAAVAAAIEGLDPERDRVRRILDRDGAAPAVLRRLAARGFDLEALDGLAADAGLVADAADPGLG